MFNRLFAAISLSAGVMSGVALGFGPLAYAQSEPAAPQVLVQGVPLVGSANGLAFDSNDKLWVANVLGQSISVLDPETGAIQRQLTSEQGVFFPDDLTFAPDGNLYWTDIAAGALLSLTSDGRVVTIAQNFPSSNPVTVSEDGRVFFAQCFGERNGIYEADPTGVTAPVAILEDVLGCAANGMDWRDGYLYVPRWFEQRVVRINVATGELETVTRDVQVPAAVKFNGRGELHIVDQAAGTVSRLSGDATQVLARLNTPLDNLAFDSSDRLFVSSSADASIHEVMANGDIRVVSPGGLNIPLSLAVNSQGVHVGELQTVRQFDPRSGQPEDVLVSTVGVGPVPFTVTGMAAVGESDLLLMDFVSGSAVLRHAEQQSVQPLQPFVTPVVGQAFMQGVAVTQLALGNIVLASGDDLSQRRILASGLPAPAGLTSISNNLYVSDLALGTVLQVVRNGQPLAEPQPVTDHPFAGIEGIASRSDHHLLVLEAGAGRLKEIDLRDGSVRILVQGMQFQQPNMASPPFGFFNQIAVDANGSVFINGDADASIYRFEHSVALRTQSQNPSGCYATGGDNTLSYLLLGDGATDVTAINTQTLRFSAPDLALQSRGYSLCRQNDINGDNHLDMLCTARDHPQSQWRVGSSTAKVTGGFQNGLPFIAEAAICTE